MTSPSEAKQEILADPEALARGVADWLLAAATAKDGVFAVALAVARHRDGFMSFWLGRLIATGSPWSHAGR
jgi:6-phosphogluconolactonase